MSPRPAIDFIFTVCGDAAGEACPIRPGRPRTAHWRIDDPAAIQGAGQRDAFLQALEALDRRISSFLAPPVDAMDEETLRSRLRAVGGSLDAATNLA